MGKRVWKTLAVAICISIILSFLPYSEKTRPGLPRLHAESAKGSRSESRPAVPETYRDQVVVLVYHNVDPEVPTPESISPRMFEDHIEMFRDRGYHVISMAQFLHFLQGGPVPDKALLLTFDDGYEGVYRYAYPILRRHHLPATVFIVARWAGRKHGWFQYMSVEELRDMQRSGLIEIGSHSYDGHRTILGKSGLTPALVAPGAHEAEADYEKRVLDDFVKSRQFFESELHVDNGIFCEPFGASSPTMIQLGKKAGYRYFFTGGGGSVTRQTPPEAIPRIDAGNRNMNPKWLNKWILQQVRPASTHGRPGQDGKTGEGAVPEYSG